MSGHDLTLLKPVVLANDDYVDTEETFVKEVYRSDNFHDGEETPVKEVYTRIQDSSFQCGQNMVILQGTRVNVTLDNVADIFDEIDQPDDSVKQRKQLQSLVQLYRDLPKDLFVNRVPSDYKSDERLLYQLRGDLFTKLKCSEKYPFAPGVESKRRKKSPRGDGVDLKLCGDIFVIISILEGAPFDELKDLISSSKYASQTENDESVLISANTPLIKSNTENCELDIHLLRNTIAAIQADVLVLKQDNGTAFDELKKPRNGFNSFKTDMVADINKLKRSVAECEQSIARICDEKSNGIATIKSDVRQIRSDITSTDETIDLRCTDLNQKISIVNKFKKRIAKIESKLVKRQEPPENPTQTGSSESVVSTSSHANMTENDSVQVGFHCRTIYW